MTTQLSLQPAEPGIHPNSRHGKLWSLAKAGGGLLALVVGFAWFVWSQGSEQRAIRDLPQDERRALLSRTLENLKSVCAAPDDGIRGWCQEEANLALGFPECDDGCKKLAWRQLSRVQSPR
jgi:hypothetical protein